MWVPVVEQLPEVKKTVIVGQSVFGLYRVFAGWLEDGSWRCFFPKHPNDLRDDPGFVAEMGDLRAGDFWLSLPEYPPTDGVVRGGYPA